MTAPLERAAKDVELVRAYLSACLSTGTRMGAAQVRENLDSLIRCVRRHDAELLRAYGGTRRRDQWAIDLIDPDKESR